jgi:hypothetical protein
MKVSRGARACVAVSTSVAAFALLIESTGLLPAVVAAVMIAAQAAGAARLRDTLTLALCLAAAVALLFVGLLRQPFRLIAGF